MTLGPLVLHLRSCLRTSWRSLLAIAVLFGLSAGLALAALASARRTDSAFDRLSVDTKASDISIDYGLFDPALAAKIAALPSVISSSTYIAFNAAPLDGDGHPVESADFETIGSLDGRFFDQDRVTVIRGRLPDPTRTDEVAINESTAQRGGIAVGDRMTLGVVSDIELEGTVDPSTLVPDAQEPVTVVGEILFGDEVIQDDNDVISRLLATPAFTAKYQDPLATYAWQGLRLQPGADVDQIGNAARDLALERGGDDSGFFLIRTMAEDRARVERAILPQVSALLMIGLLVAVVAVVLLQQAAVRQIRLMESDLSTFRSFGLGPGSLTATAAAPLLVAVGVGTIIAVLAAFAASPLSPFGALHRVEVDPGFDLDARVVLGGAGALAFVSCLSVVAAAHGAARRTARTRSSLMAAQPSRVAGRAQKLGLPASVYVGAGHALQPQSGPSAAPVRVVAVGTVVAVAALVASLCFGSSLDRLVDNPRLYGWNWDVAVIDQAGYGAIDTARASEALDSDPSVAGWAPLGISSTAIDGLTVPVVGVRQRDEVGPAILDGRAVANQDEIVLGRSTLRTLGKEIGDTVDFGPTSRLVRIVGTATLPAIGQVHSSHPSPGEGAIVLIDVDLGTGSAGESEAPVAVVRLLPGENTAAVRERLRETTSAIGEYPGSAEFLEVSRPAEIINARSITVAPAVAAAVLALAALISLSLSLVAAVRQRRVDLATLKALGFTRRQVATTIVTQSFVITAAGIVIGVPAGIIAGRWLWARFAERVSVVNSPSIPIGALLVACLALTAGALLVAVAPSLIASRIPARDTLPRD